jgi:hypothetical protein
VSPSIGDRIANLTARLPSFGGRSKARGRTGAGKTGKPPTKPQKSSQAMNGHGPNGANGHGPAAPRQVPPGLQFDPPQQIPGHFEAASPPPSFEDAAAMAATQQTPAAASSAPSGNTAPADMRAQPDPAQQPQSPQPPPQPAVQQQAAPSAGALALADNEWLAAHGLEKSFGRPARCQRRVFGGAAR